LKRPNRAIGASCSSSPEKAATRRGSDALELSIMRTTVSISDELPFAAKRRARERGQTLI